MPGWAVLALGRWLFTPDVDTCQHLWFRLTEHGETLMRCVPATLY